MRSEPDYNQTKPDSGYGHERLYILGKPTSLEIDTSSNAVRPTDVVVHRTRKGVIYGYIDHTESGATLVSTDIAFVQDHGKFFQKGGYATTGCRGESILLVPMQSGPWIQEDHAFLYQNGKLTDVGYAHEAGFGKGGAIVGWYYAHEDGAPSGGVGADFDFGTYKQYFEFKYGVRKLTGRKSIS